MGDELDIGNCILLIQVYVSILYRIKFHTGLSNIIPFLSSVIYPVKSYTLIFNKQKILKHTKAIYIRTKMKHITYNFQQQRTCFAYLCKKTTFKKSHHI